MSISRGYYGYHNTWENKNFFLRSQGEYIVALWLDLKNISYEVEPYNFGKFRPDFVIFSKKTIIEVKSSTKERMDTIVQRKEYYKNLGFRLISIGNYWHFSKLKRIIPNIDQKLKDWKNQDKSFITLEGKNNPHYGMKQTELTKKIIGEKCKKRNENIEYKNKNSMALKKFYDSEKGKLLKLKTSNLRKKTRKTYWENTYCPICYKKTKILIKNADDIHPKTCSAKCRGKWASKIYHMSGKKRISDKHLASYGVLQRVLNIWQNAGLTIDIIKTGNFKNFLQDAQSKGLLSKRTTIRSENWFINNFNNLDNLENILIENKKYGKIDFKKNNI